MEAKTDVNFWLIDEATGEERSLNGITRAETDKNIRKVFASFSKLASLASFASIARAERGFGTRVQRFECRFEGFRDAPEILSKIFENLRQNLGPSEKTKIAHRNQNHM